MIDKLFENTGIKPLEISYLICENPVLMEGNISVVHYIHRKFKLEDAVIIHKWDLIEDCRKNRVYIIALVSFGIGITAVLLGVIASMLPIFWLFIAVWTITGIAIPLYNTPVTVMLQEKVKEDFRGRVFGVLNMISSSVMSMGMCWCLPIFRSCLHSIAAYWERSFNHNSELCLPCK